MLITDASVPCSVPVQFAPMFRVSALTLALFALAACKKEEAAPIAPSGPQPELFVDRALIDAGAAAIVESEHLADDLAEISVPDVKVTEALVLQYLGYRKLVVQRGRDAVEKLQQEAEEAKKEGEGTPVNLTRRAETFAITLRAIEERAREENRLSRDEVIAVGQAVGEVFAARQIWRMSGGDEALERARRRLATIPGAKRPKAEAALARNEKSFAVMRDATSARKRFGDVAVDAVLAHEDALWKVQQDGAKVMSAVY